MIPENLLINEFVKAEFQFGDTPGGALWAIIKDDFYERIINNFNINNLRTLEELISIKWNLYNDCGEFKDIMMTLVITMKKTPKTNEIRHIFLLKKLHDCIFTNYPINYFSNNSHLIFDQWVNDKLHLTHLHQKELITYLFSKDSGMSILKKLIVKEIIDTKIVFYVLMFMKNPNKNHFSLLDYYYKTPTIKDIKTLNFKEKNDSALICDIFPFVSDERIPIDQELIERIKHYKLPIEITDFTYFSLLINGYFTYAEYSKSICNINESRHNFLTTYKILNNL